MSLRLQVKETVPPGGWPYVDPETGRKFAENCGWRDFLKRIKAHRRSNNLPIALNFEGEVEQYVVQRVPAEWCYRTDLLPQAPPPTWGEALQATAILVDWGAHGFKRETRLEANRRAGICFNCKKRVGFSGCTTCSLSKMREIVLRVIGDPSTEPSMINSGCGVCGGCGLEAKVWFPLDVLHRHTTEKQKAEYPDFCWLKTSNAMKNVPLTIVPSKKFFDVEHSKRGEGGWLYIDNLPPGSGAWIDDVLDFMCPCGCGMVGGISISGEYRWELKGSKDKPSLTPSILMKGPCGWHGYLTNGEFIKC